MRKTSKVTKRRKEKESEGTSPSKKILTAEGWKRLMLGRSRKSSSKEKH